MGFKGFYTLLLISLLFLSGCSDVNDGKAKGRNVTDPSLAEANCDINADNFEYLLEREITPDIECAYKKVNLLIKLVRKEKPELQQKNISRTTLENFITRKVPDAIGVVEYLDLFFTLNTFIVGSQEDLIIANDFKVLKDFLIMLNKNFSKIFKYFFKENDEIIIKQHNIKLDRIRFTLQHIIQGARADGADISLVGLLNRNTKDTRSIDLNEFMGHLKVKESARSWLFLKKLLMGGDPKIITNHEFYDFLYKKTKNESGQVVVENKVLRAVEVGYNLYRHKNLSFDNEYKRYNFQKRNFKVAKQLIANESKLEPLLTITDLTQWLNYFFEKDLFFGVKKINLLNYGWEFTRIKEIFLGSNSENITREDVYKFFDILDDASNIGSDFSRLYENNKTLMGEKKVRITKDTKLLNLKNLEDPKNFDLFSYVLQTFRFMQGTGVKGEKRMPNYGSEYDRDNKSLIYYGQLEFALGKIAKFYEKKYPCHIERTYNIYNYVEKRTEQKRFFHDYYCTYGHHPRKEDYLGNLDVGQLYFIILEFRQLFQDIGIVNPGEEDKAAENATTVPDLFIYAANDDGIVQVSELLEFFFNVFNATSIKNDVLDQLQASESNSEPSFQKVAPINCQIVDYLKKDGGELNTEEPRYDAKCIRENFYTFLNQDTRYGDKNIQYLSNLDDFYKNNRRTSLGRKDLKRYTLLLEGYTKACPYDNMPYTQSDIMALYTGMYSIESTMAKLDLDGNNKISPDETQKAYEHFYYGLEAIVLDELKGEAGVGIETPEESKYKVVRYFNNLWKNSKNKAIDFNIKGIVESVFKYLVHYKKLPLPISENLIKLGNAKFLRDYPEIGRDTIASILVILMDFTKPKRQKRYERAGLEYTQPDEICRKKLPEDQSELIRKEWECSINKNCD